MGRFVSTVVFDISQISWDEFVFASGGGGGGQGPSLTPYVWSIFFKIDGSGLLFGGPNMIFLTPAFQFSVGSHGTLGNKDFHVGSMGSLPPDVGVFQDTIEPIRLGNLFEEQPGWFGAIAVALKWGHVTDQGAEAGHQAFNAIVQNDITKAVQALKPGAQPDFNKIKAQIQSDLAAGVKKAIQNSQTLFQNVWAEIAGPDAPIGFASWIFNQDVFAVPTDSWDLTLQPNLQVLNYTPISDTFGQFGQWSFKGTAFAYETICPVAFIAVVIKRHGPDFAIRSRIDSGVGAMREFRDSGKLAEVPTAISWWRRAGRHTGELAHLITALPELRGHLVDLFCEIEGVLGSPSEPIDGHFLDVLTAAFDTLMVHGSSTLAGDAARAGRIVSSLRGRSPFEIEEVLFRESSPLRVGEHPSSAADTDVPVAKGAPEASGIDWKPFISWQK